MNLAPRHECALTYIKKVLANERGQHQSVIRSMSCRRSSGYLIAVDAAHRPQFYFASRSMMIAVQIVRVMMGAGRPVVSHARDTLRGYLDKMKEQSKGAILRRLSRIEGQIRGVASMVADDRYCIDIVTQISAVQAALQRAKEELLRDHVSYCVEGVIKSGSKSKNKADRGKKIAELMHVFSRSRG